MWVPIARTSARPCTRVIPAGSSRSSFVAKLPSVQITRGCDQLDLAHEVGRAVLDLAGRGSRLPGGRHFSTLAMKTSARAQPDLAEQLLEQLARRRRRTEAPGDPRWRRAPRRRTSARRRRYRRRTPPCVRVAASSAARAAARRHHSSFSASRRSLGSGHRLLRVMFSGVPPSPRPGTAHASPGSSRNASPPLSGRTARNCHRPLGNGAPARYGMSTAVTVAGRTQQQTGRPSSRDRYPDGNWTE